MYSFEKDRYRKLRNLNTINNQQIVYVISFEGMRFAGLLGFFIITLLIFRFLSFLDNSINSSKLSKDENFASLIMLKNENLAALFNL